jgi:hypothetical protein
VEALDPARVGLLLPDGPRGGDYSSADASPIARCSAAGFSLDYRHVAGLLPLRWCGGLVVGVVAAVAWW